MGPRTRLFAPDRQEIVDLGSWFGHAPPERGCDQWKDGYSAKEQAKAWLRPGTPAVPEELWAAVEELAGGADELYGRPEHRTPLDEFGRARQHDMFGCARRDGETTLVIGIEAKACEDYGGVVADRAMAEAPSNKRARCNLMSRALFGRDVLEEKTGEILDEDLSRHGYQLWTAAVGTLLEAQRRGVETAVLVVHQFEPVDVDAVKLAGDRRNWRKAIGDNATAFDAFATALADAGGISQATEFVKPGTPLHLRKVTSSLTAAA